MQNKIILHHSAVSREKNAQQFAAIDRYHKGKGWGEIGYHFLIEPDGKICRGRNLQKSGAHCVGKNDCIGICLTGNFDTEEPTNSQIASLKKLVADLKISRENFYFHREFANKTCPGKNIDKENLLNTLFEEKIPDWAQPTVDKMKAKGIKTPPTEKVGEMPLYQLLMTIDKFIK